MKAIFVATINKELKFWQNTPNEHFAKMVESQIDKKVFELELTPAGFDYNELYYNLGKCRAAAGLACGDRTCLKKFIVGSDHSKELGFYRRVYAWDSDGKFQQKIGYVFPIIRDMEVPNVGKEVSND